MHHFSDFFTREPIEEWLIYFKQSWGSKFSVSLVCDGTERVIKGRDLPRGSALSLEMETSRGFLCLNLDLDRNAKRPRRVSDVWTGDLMLAEVRIGCCRVQHSHIDEIPIMQIEMEDPRCRIKVFRTEAPRGISTLLVRGIDDCEMVLEGPPKLGMRRPIKLPKVKPKRDFVGSCRAINFAPDPVGHALSQIALVVAVVQLLVREKFTMTM